MGWIENLRGEKVGLDTAPFIYFIEENQTYLPVIRPFFEALDRGSFSGITSAVTLLEVLVQPFRLNDEDTAQRYREILLNARNLKTMAVSPEIAEKAAKLRATYNLRTPDA
ncbi:MAG: PIN domain-containing protein, partial [Bacillota bacterium]